MSVINEGMEYGCLFCRTGSEDAIVRKLQQRYPDAEIFAPSKVRHRRQAGRLEDELVVLFPGYVFFAASQQFDPRHMVDGYDVYRLLRYQDSGWQLMGADRALAQRFHSAGGVVGMSQAYFDGDRIRIVDGFMKDYEGQIMRVNRRAQTAQVVLSIAGRSMTVWLGYELMEHSGE